jgi:hypothetical protein
VNFGGHVKRLVLMGYWGTSESCETTSHPRLHHRHRPLLTIEVWKVEASVSRFFVSKRANLSVDIAPADSEAIVARFLFEGLKPV